MAAIQAAIMRCVDGPVDFKGQKLGEQIYQVLVITLSIVAFIVGYVKQDFHYTFLIWAVGAGLSVLITLPSWPWLFNKNPVKFLDPPAEVPR